MADNQKQILKPVRYLAILPTLLNVDEDVDFWFTGRWTIGGGTAFVMGAGRGGGAYKQGTVYGKSLTYLSINWINNNCSPGLGTSQ